MIYAKYTMVLKTIMDDSEGMALLNKAMSTYPLYEKRSKEQWIPSYVPTRSELNQKILNHYKYREIGFESVGRFVDELEIALCEIMPKYNLLYHTADQDYNMLYNADYTRRITTTRDGSETSDTESSVQNSTETTSSDSSTATSSNNDASKSVTSQTPQNELDITAQNIDSVGYADQVDWNKSDSTGNTSTSGNSNSTSDTSGSGNVKGEISKQENEESFEELKGNYGQMSYQYLVKKYRELIINIEQMIMNDPRIQELFMMVY